MTTRSRRPRTSVKGPRAPHRTAPSAEDLLRRRALIGLWRRACAGFLRLALGPQADVTRLAVGARWTDAGPVVEVSDGARCLLATTFPTLASRGPARTLPIQLTVAQHLARKAGATSSSVAAAPCPTCGCPARARHYLRDGECWWQSPAVVAGSQEGGRL